MTHLVASSLKRLVVIVSSVLFFRTPISPINALGTELMLSFMQVPITGHLIYLCLNFVFFSLPAGTGVALAGVFLYSQFKKLKPKTKAA